MDIDEVNWSCHVCTFLNSFTLTVCDVCNTKRPYNEDNNGQKVFKLTKHASDSDNNVPKVFNYYQPERNSPSEPAPRVFNISTDERPEYTEVEEDGPPPRVFKGMETNKKSSSRDSADGCDKTVAASSVVTTANKNDGIENKDNNGKKNAVESGKYITKKVNGGPIQRKPVNKVTPQKVTKPAPSTSYKASNSYEPSSDKLKKVSKLASQSKSELPKVVRKTSESKSSLSTVNSNSEFKWICPSLTCKTENDQFMDMCICCHTERTGDVVLVRQTSKNGIDLTDKARKTKEDTSIGTTNNSETNKPSNAFDVEYKSEDDVHWSCSKCTLQNASTTHKCIVCEAPRQPKIPSPESIPIDLDYSKYPPSTTPTSPSLEKPPKYNVAGSSSRSKTSDHAKKTPIWRCKECTTPTNKANDEKCTICGKGVRPSWMKGVNSQDKMNQKDLPKVPQKPAKVPRLSGEQKKPVLKGRVPLKNKPLKQRVEPVPKPAAGKGSTVAENKETKASEGISWRCSVCTLENPNSESVCKACDNEIRAKPDEWTCHTCTLLNSANETVCKVCNTKRLDPSIKTDPKIQDEKLSDDSTCVQNKKDEIIEDIKRDSPEVIEIDSPREMVKFKKRSYEAQVTKAVAAKLEKENSISGTFSCSVCTFLNSSMTGSCKMCGFDMQKSLQDDRIESFQGTIRLKHSLKRQQSSSFMELRDIEDSEAKELWEHIKLFCRQVSEDFWYPW